MVSRWASAAALLLLLSTTAIVDAATKKVTSIKDAETMEKNRKAFRKHFNALFKILPLVYSYSLHNLAYFWTCDAQTRSVENGH